MLAMPRDCEHRLYMLPISRQSSACASQPQACNVYIYGVRLARGYNPAFPSCFPFETYVLAILSEVLPSSCFM